MLPTGGIRLGGRYRDTWPADHCSLRMRRFRRPLYRRLIDLSTFEAKPATARALDRLNLLQKASKFIDDIVARPGRNSIRVKSRQLWRSIEILFLVGAGTAGIPL
jgi:hypothetical protein